MKNKVWPKKILSAIAIIVGGFVLWNLAFVLAAAVSFCWRAMLGIPNDQIAASGWRYLFLALVLIISWFVLRAKRVNTLIKATYFTMPLMVILILEGIQLYAYSNWLAFIIGAIIDLAVLFYLYKKKSPWQYYFATIFTGATALIVMLAGIDI